MRSLWLLALTAAFLLAASAAHAAPQFTPAAGDRLHSLGSGQPGAEWDTSGLGAGGQVAYDSGTQMLSVTAGLNTMNTWNAGNGACPTDSGSNCGFNFGPDLDITLNASLDSISVAPVGGTFVNVTVSFGSTGGVDLVITDPSDGGSVQLQASVASGVFQGNPTTGFAASVVYDTASGTVFGAVNAAGFLQVDQATPFASLFQPDFFGINISAFSDFAGSGGGLDAIIAELILTGVIPSFTAEANGQILNTVSGDFVPEPGTALLLGTALLGLSRRRRS